MRELKFESTYLPYFHDNVLTRAPLALQIFHHLLGGGMNIEHPPVYLGSYWS